MLATLSVLKAAAGLTLERGTTLAKRAISEVHKDHMGDGMIIMMGKDDKQPAQIQMPGMFWFALVAVFLVFLPILFLNIYTLHQLVPTLAMIEDPAPPAYDPVSITADDEENVNNSNSPKTNDGNPATPVTTSLRRTFRMLRSIAGFRSLFRGFWCAFFTFVGLSVAEGFFAGLIPSKSLAVLIAPLPAILLTLPLNTAWMHIIMSAPRSARWYRRLPPMRTTIIALWRPALIMWAALALFSGVHQILLKGLGLADEALKQEPNYSAISWKAIISILIIIVLEVCVIVPARVIFARCQASLLPLEDEPILFFDRSFAGAIPPEVVGGQGYASVAVAWSTFSKAAWVRLIKLYVKVIALSIAIIMVFLVVMVPIVVIGRKHATVITSGGK